MIKKLWAITLVRYCLIGGVSYAIELAVLFTLHANLHLQRTVAAGIAFWVGLTISFVLQKLLAFKDFNKEAKVVAKQGATYAVLVAWNYFVTLLIVSLFPNKYLLYSRTLALLITTAWNYLVYKRYIFNKEPTSSSSRPLEWIVSKKKQILFGIALSIPVLLFFYHFLTTGSQLYGGDFDYYAQMYEAFRISVLHFHQFPLWNPWMSGGLPLYANPQFGLVSIQSPLVLLFGTIYGLKLAYVAYALAGFWGMYALSKKVAGATKVRASLISYIWVFCGFFASHSIYHFTFSSFFLLPWVIYFIAIRKEKWAWLGLFTVESIIILSSVHYAFLFLALAAGLLLCLISIKPGMDRYRFSLSIARSDLLFIIKVAVAVAVVSGYRFVTTYLFIANNQRPLSQLNDTPNSIIVLLKATFFPLGNRFLSIPKGLQWPWGEYSMYVGLGVTLACLVCLYSIVSKLVTRRKLNLKNNLFLVYILIIGIICLFLALGSFSKASPYSILHLLPGFGQMRVSSRWVILFVFSILYGLAAAKNNSKLLNILLAFAVAELFITYGPVRNVNQGTVNIPVTKFNQQFEEYDNGRKHLDFISNIDHSYFFSTRENKGLVYSDDSIINTLERVLGTSRCGINVRATCTFVMSGNASVIRWTPNNIELIRTRPGPIEINMNVDSGWQVNNKYLYGVTPEINPVNRFIIPSSTTKNYTLEYAPRLSPAWFGWEAQLRL